MEYKKTKEDKRILLNDFYLTNTFRKWLSGQNKKNPNNPDFDLLIEELKDVDERIKNQNLI